MGIEGPDQIEFSQDNFSSLRTIIAQDITKIQDALSDTSQNPTIHQQLEPIIKQNKKILESLDTIAHEYAVNPAETIRSRGQKYAVIVQYVLRNHPHLESLLKRGNTTLPPTQHEAKAVKQEIIAPPTVESTTTSTRNSVEEFSINLASLRRTPPLFNMPDNSRSVVQDIDTTRPLLESVDMIRSSISSTHSAKQTNRTDAGGHVAASVSSLQAPSITTNTKLQDIANSDISLFSLATMASLEAKSNDCTLMDPSPMRQNYAYKARDSPVIIKLDESAQHSPIHGNIMSTIYTVDGSLIDPSPHHSRQTLYELARKYKERAEKAVSRIGSTQAQAQLETKIASLTEENSALKVSLHSALNELSELKQKLMHPSHSAAVYEGALTTENMSLKETIARKNCELIKQGQELKETRDVAEDLQKTKQHLTHLTDVLLEERKLLQDEILNLKPGGKGSNSIKEVESMCRHVVALEKQLHTELGSINVEITEHLSSKLQSTISVYEQMLMKIKTRAVGRPHTPDLHRNSANLSLQSFSPYTSSTLANTSITEPRNASFTSSGNHYRSLGNSLTNAGNFLQQNLGGSSSRPGSARGRVSSQSVSLRASSSKKPTARSAPAPASKAVSPDVLTYEVVKVLTELGPRAPSLQRIGPREWIVERNGIVISLNMGQSGGVVVESEGGVPLLQFLKRIQDPPTRTQTSQRLKSPRRSGRPDDPSIGRRSPAFDPTGLSMFDAMKRMMTHKV